MTIVTKNHVAANGDTDYYSRCKNLGGPADFWAGYAAGHHTLPGINITQKTIFTILFKAFSCLLGLCFSKKINQKDLLY